MQDIDKQAIIMYYTCITLKYKRSHIPVHTMHVLDIWLTQYDVRRHSSKVVDRGTFLNSMSTEQGRYCHQEHRRAQHLDIY